jgi:hypothetical protein
MRLESMTLYGVTTIHPSREGERAGITSSRTVAMCTRLERARQIVEGNEGDIFETTERLVVISTLSSDVVYGAVGCPDYQEWWYRWEGTWQDGRYVPTEKPEEFRHVIGWAE